MQAHFPYSQIEPEPGARARPTAKSRVIDRTRAKHSLKIPRISGIW